MEHIELSRCNHREREFDGSAKGEVMGGDQLDYTDGMDFNLLGNEQTHMFTHSPSPSMSLLKTTIQFLCDTQQSNTDLINHKAFITVSSAVSCLWTPTNSKRMNIIRVITELQSWVGHTATVSSLHGDNGSLTQRFPTTEPRKKR